jgi:hypothetical protein
MGVVDGPFTGGAGRLPGINGWGLFHRQYWIMMVAIILDHLHGLRANKSGRTQRPCRAEKCAGTEADSHQFLGTFLVIGHFFGTCYMA